MPETTEITAPPKATIKSWLTVGSIHYISALIAAIIWLVLVCEHMTPVQPFVDMLEFILGGVGVVHSFSTIAGK